MCVYVTLCSDCIYLYFCNVLFTTATICIYVLFIFNFLVSVVVFIASLTTLYCSKHNHFFVHVSRNCV